MMLGRRRASKAARIRAGVAAAIAAAGAVLLIVVQLPAGAQTLPDATKPVTGNATWFDGLGSPYGGCGVPQDQLDSQNFVALNVYNTPGDYKFYPRPLAGADLAKAGYWNNGLNCGRWVEVTLSDYCTGVNDGAANKEFCRNGSWVSDDYNGAKLMMQVADSCGDDNGWCRDDPYHLDFSKASLTEFVKDGAKVTDLYPTHWNNRHISWKFAPAPNYTGDIGIGFMRGAMVWWPAIAVTHLANGIHGVEYLNGGTWKPAKMNGDMGQSYIIDGLTSGANNFQIRVRDVNDELINGGRVYSFTLPTSCGSTCSEALTPVKYTTSGGSTKPTTPTTTAPTTPSSAPTVTAPTTPTSATSAPTNKPTLAPTTAFSSPATSGCSATSTVTTSWMGGFQAMVTVTAGNAPINGWSVEWKFANGEQVAQLWSASYATSGSTVTAHNVAWNGALAANTSTSFGYSGSGTPKAVTVRCTAS